jgi:Mg2+-importing ATPase
MPADYWSRPAPRLLEDLASTPRGLGETEARARLEAVGPNAMSGSGPRPGACSEAIQSPLVLILVFATIVSPWPGLCRRPGHPGDRLRERAHHLLAEYTASRAVKRARLVHRISVLREGAPGPCRRDIVPGDVMLLSAGSLLGRQPGPRGQRFLRHQAADRRDFPGRKAPGEAKPEAGLAERTNCVFMGTTVRSGTASVLVAQTGAGTSFGRIADRLARRPPETEFERGIRRFGLMLSQIMVALILVVFGMNIISVKPPLDSLLFAIALAVGISPELLPAIITINLSRGAREMARHGVIVRRLNSIENLGSMDVLCTDKTS